ncbi:hypothetical protein BDSB_28840 [Burkholderia dolosa PC543]|nr:hypothetical protein BDSB_28840 [Burkholderia dolosa PC543]
MRAPISSLIAGRATFTMLLSRLTRKRLMQHIIRIPWRRLKALGMRWKIGMAALMLLPTQ